MRMHGKSENRINETKMNNNAERDANRRFCHFLFQDYFESMQKLRTVRKKDNANENKTKAK